MALPKYRRYVLVNNSGQTLTFDNNARINIKETVIHYDTTNGKLIYTDLVADDLGFVAGSSIINGGEIVGDVEVDNTVNLYVQSQVQIEVIHDEGLAADGEFALHVAKGLVSGELETDASGYESAEGNKVRFVGALTWESNGLDDEQMRSEPFSVG